MTDDRLAAALSNDADPAAHAAGRRRLLLALESEAVPATPSPLRRIVMDRRSWAATAAAVAVGCGVFLFGGPAPVALADGLKTFKAEKSFRCRLVPLVGGEPAAAKENAALRIVWASPGSLRSEMLADGKPTLTTVLPHRGDGVMIDHAAKTFTRLDADSKPGGKQEATILRVINGLATTAAPDAKPAATDDIDGVSARRFDVRTPDPGDATASWQHRVWLHPTTGRPVRVEFALVPGQAIDAPKAFGVRLEKFEWGVKTDDLFEPTPPAGFKPKATDAAAAADLMTPQIVAGLKAYRDAVGSYPPDEPFDTAAVTAKLKDVKISPEAFKGIVLVGVLQAAGADAKYRGKAVGPADAEKVLFRWKLSDGRYRVIYGDLKSATLSADALAAAEAK